MERQVTGMHSAGPDWNRRHQYKPINIHTHTQRNTNLYLCNMCAHIYAHVYLDMDVYVSDMSDTCECVCKHTPVHIYFLGSLMKGPRSSGPSAALNIPSTQVLVSVDRSLLK